MSRLQDIAASYVGTPHINAGTVKGAGLDCCTLPAAIFHEVYGIKFAEALNYSSDWFCKKDCVEILLPILEKYCYRVDDMREGDIISYAWARAKYAHLGVYLGNGRIIHCSASEGTIITNIESSAFYYPNGKSRQTGIWRLKNELFIQRQ